MSVRYRTSNCNPRYHLSCSLRAPYAFISKAYRLTHEYGSPTKCLFGQAAPGCYSSLRSVCAFHRRTLSVTALTTTSPDLCLYISIIFIFKDLSTKKIKGGKIPPFLFNRLVEGSLCLLCKSCECCGVCNCDFGKHLSVEIDVCLLETVHEC